MEIEEQAVVEATDVQQEAVTEEDNAQDLDLDNLLQEYSGDEKTEEVTQTQETSVQSDDDTKQLLQLMKQQMEDTNRKAAATELNDTVKSIKGDIGVEDDFVKAFLNMKAEGDPRLRQAYIEKGNNPKAWSKIEKSLRSELGKFIGGLANKSATDTREAVTASVLNSKTTQKSETKTSKDLAKMSDIEFEDFKQASFKAGRGL